MLHSDSNNFVLAVNENLQIAVVQNNQFVFSLPQMTEKECRLNSNNTCIRIIHDNVNFFYCESLNFPSLLWVNINDLHGNLEDKVQEDILSYFLNHPYEFVTSPQLTDSLKFVEALRNGNLEQLRKIPKSDLHNHAPLGGSRHFLKELTGYTVPKLTKRFDSILEMNTWTKANIKGKLNIENEYVSRTLASFLQAEYDGITVFAPNFALCARKDFQSYEELLNFIEYLKERFSDSMHIYPELCLDRHKIDSEREKEASKLLNTGTFYSLDVTGDEALGVDSFIGIYKEASSIGIIRKAHVGEFCDSTFVEDAILKLDLNTIQHGLSAIKSERTISLMKERNISATICPSSNYFLSRVNSIACHPVNQFTSCNIPVTICSDDILIFDSSVSCEYLKLYNASVLSEYELNNIRIFGLQYYQN